MVKYFITSYILYGKINELKGTLRVSVYIIYRDESWIQPDFFFLAGEWTGFTIEIK